MLDSWNLSIVESLQEEKWIQKVSLKQDVPFVLPDNIPAKLKPSQSSVSRHVFEAGWLNFTVYTFFLFCLAQWQLRVVPKMKECQKMKAAPTKHHHPLKGIGTQVTNPI